MRKTQKNISIEQIDMRVHILHSMINSFKIEGIDISDQIANEIFEKVERKLR
jgi:hypothetical protein